MVVPVTTNVAMIMDLAIANLDMLVKTVTSVILSIMFPPLQMEKLHVQVNDCNLIYCRFVMVPSNLDLQ